MPTNLTPLPDLDWAEYRQIVSRRDSLAADLRQTQNDVDRLRRTRGDAERADEDARAAAMISGAKDPGKKITDKHAADLAAAEDRARLLERAVQTQDAAALALVQADPERAQQAAEAEAHAAGQTYAALVAAVTEARTAFHAARRASAWVQDPTRKWKPTAVPGLEVRGLTTANGDPADVSLVLAAMVAEVEDDPDMIDGPWRGTRIRRDEAVRLVRRVRTEFSENGQPLSATHYAIPAHEVPRDEAERQAALAAQEKRQQDKIRQAVAAKAREDAPAQQAPSATPSATPAPTGADPLADLRVPR